MRGVLLFALLLMGCPSPSASDAGSDDAGGKVDAGPLRPCVERPTDALQPPGSQLPCELLPPSFAP